jgi:cytochrome c5
MQLHRSFSVTLSLLALQLSIACGEADDGDNMTPSPTGTTTATVTPTTTSPVAPASSSAPVNPTPTSSAPVTPQPGPPDAWTEVYGIFQAKCDNGGCHGPGDPFPPQLVGDEATVLPAAEGKAARIVERVMSVAIPMPPAGSMLSLTDAEKASIQAWASSVTP